VKEISMEQHRVEQQGLGAEAAEDSLALPEAEDSNLVWERLLRKRPV
jgi:hypothetical protein